MEECFLVSNFGQVLNFCSFNLVHFPVLRFFISSSLVQQIATEGERLNLSILLCRAKKSE